MLSNASRRPRQFALDSTGRATGPNITTGCSRILWQRYPGGMQLVFEKGTTQSLHRLPSALGVGLPAVETDLLHGGIDVGKDVIDDAIDSTPVASSSPDPKRRESSESGHLARDAKPDSS